MSHKNSQAVSIVNFSSREVAEKQLATKRAWKARLEKEAKEASKRKEQELWLERVEKRRLEKEAVRAQKRARRLLRKEALDPEVALRAYENGLLEKDVVEPRAPRVLQKRAYSESWRFSSRPMADNQGLLQMKEDLVGRPSEASSAYEDGYLQWYLSRRSTVPAEDAAPAAGALAVLMETIRGMGILQVVLDLLDVETLEGVSLQEVQEAAEVAAAELK